MNTNKTSMTMRFSAMTLALCATLLSVGCDPEDESGPQTLSCDDVTEKVGLRLEDRNDEVDYILNCDWNVSGDSSIAPGVVIQVGKDFGIHVDSDDASLSAVGTAAAPIVLSGVSATRGSWAGVYFDSENDNNALEHITIEHAGGRGFTSNDYRGSVAVFGASKLTMKQVTLREGKSTGLNVDNKSTLSLSDLTITTHDGQPIWIPAENITDLDATLKLTGNGDDVVRILTPEVTGVSGTWRKLSVPYLVAPNLGDLLSINGGAKVTIEAGTELQFRAEAGLVIADTDDMLIAQGTAEAPIRFIGREQGVATWRGIYFGSGNAQNLIDHAEIKGGGFAGFNSNENTGGVVIYAEGAATISNTVISDTNTCGISAEYENGQLTDGGGNTYSGVQIDICLPAE